MCIRSRRGRSRHLTPRRGRARPVPARPSGASDSDTQDVYKVNSLTLSTRSNAVDGHTRGHVTTTDLFTGPIGDDDRLGASPVKG